MVLSPDPQGEAALLLCEGLFQLLLETDIVTKDNVLHAIEDIIAARQANPGATGDDCVSIATIGVLRAIGVSLAATPAGTSASRRPAEAG